jgi:hypothetical protein
MEVEVQAKLRSTFKARAEKPSGVKGEAENASFPRIDRAPPWRLVRPSGLMGWVRSNGPQQKPRRDRDAALRAHRPLTRTTIWSKI